MRIVRDYAIGDGAHLRVKFEHQGFTYTVPVVYMRKRFLLVPIFVRVYDGEAVGNIKFRKMLKDEVVALADQAVEAAERYLRSWGKIK